jgi:hypothetical protein
MGGGGGNKLPIHVLRSKTELTGRDIYYFKEKPIRENASALWLAGIWVERKDQ